MTSPPDLKASQSWKPADVVERLVSALEDGDLVPFLGAGVSSRAEYDGPSPEAPHSSMIAHLSQELMSLASRQHQVWEILQGMVPRLGTLGEDPVRQLQEIEAQGLAKLSEVLVVAQGYDRLCDTLKIAEFIHLVPTTAHRAMSALMREGLIREVITTNYDRCLERAWEDTGAQELDVVTSAREYMGAVRNRQERACWPRLYKINGCARAFVRAKGKAREAAARRIILTERQLQTFREERWAEDMFRDRARRSHLVFSGFGSEEPQIRHTALALAEEYRRYDLGDDHVDPWALRSAPYVQVHGTTLSFNQTQILWGYFTAWFDVPPRLEQENPFPTAITGKHASYFHDDEDKLTADAFWRALLNGWWARRFRQSWTDERSDLNKGMARRIFETEAQRAVLQDAIGEAVRILFHAGATSARERAPRCPLLETGGPKGDTPFARVFRDIDPDAFQASYVPFSENEVLVATVLLLFAWAWTRGGQGKTDPVTPRRLPMEALKIDGVDVWELRDHLLLDIDGAVAPPLSVLDDDRDKVWLRVPRSAWEARIPDSDARGAHSRRTNQREIDCFELLREAADLLSHQADPHAPDALFSALDQALVWRLVNAPDLRRREGSFRRDPTTFLDMGAPRA